MTVSCMTSQSRSRHSPLRHNCSCLGHLQTSRTPSVPPNRKVPLYHDRNDFTLPSLQGVQDRESFDLDPSLTSLSVSLLHFDYLVFLCRKLDCSIYAVKCMPPPSFVVAHLDDISTSPSSWQHQDLVRPMFLVCLAAGQHGRAHCHLAGNSKRSD